MPQLLRFAEINAGRLPRRLVAALAATMVLYRGDIIALSDDPATLAWFQQAWARVDGGEWSLAQLASGWLAEARLWGRDLNTVPGLADAVGVALEQIRTQGMRTTLG